MEGGRGGGGVLPRGEETGLKGLMGEGVWGMLKGRAAGSIGSGFVGPGTFNRDSGSIMRKWALLSALLDPGPGS